MRHLFSGLLTLGVFLLGLSFGPASAQVQDPAMVRLETADDSRGWDAVGKLVAGFDVSTLGGGPVLVATVVNVNDMSRAAPLGRTLSEQYASVMSAKGFNVKEIKLRGDVFVKEGTGELLLSREIKDIARSQNATLVLVGTYSAAANFTYVSLKLVRTEDSRIVRGHDYALPNDRDVQRMLTVPR